MLSIDLPKLREVQAKVRHIEVKSAKGGTNPHSRPPRDHKAYRPGVCPMKTGTTCRLADGFSIGEKIYAQFSFLAMGLTGTVGIALVDWRWVPPYLVIYVYGILGVVMRHLNCPRCPHLHDYNDCLQAPLKLTKWLVKERKTTPFSRFETFLFYAIFILIPVFPIYWLLANPVLLGAFLATAAMWYGGQFLYFCRRCRVKECPFNRAAALRAPSA